VGFRRYGPAKAITDAIYVFIVAAAVGSGHKGIVT
jgi:hypothetical protein